MVFIIFSFPKCFSELLRAFVSGIFYSIDGILKHISFSMKKSRNYRTNDVFSVIPKILLYFPKMSNISTQTRDKILIKLSW